MKKILALSLFILIYHSSSAGGGWTQPRGAGYFKLGQNVIIADKFYNLEGNIIDITTIGYYSTSLYGEYGLTDRLTALLYMPFFVRSTLNDVQGRQTGQVDPGDEVNSFGDTDIGIKYALLQKKVVVSATLLLGLAFGKTAEGFAADGDNRILQTGDGEFNQMIFIDASHSFYPFPSYISAGVGFNNRTKDFSDEFRASAEWGIQPLKGLNIALKMYLVQSLENGSETAGSGSGVFGNNIEYLSYGPEISYEIKEKYGVAVSWAGATAGRNVLAAPNYGFGLFYKL